MEVTSGAVLKTMIPCCYSGTGAETGIGKSISSVSCFRGGNWFPSLKESAKIRAIGKTRKWDCGFEDNGHLDYYMVCGEGKKGKKGWNGVSTKKKMKLLKGLTENLSMFSELGFGVELNCGDEGLGGEDKSKMISQAAEVLLAQLKQLRAEEENSKKMEKLEKQKSKQQDCESSSSSSSSESSSDSECDEVVDMTRFKNKVVAETKATQLGNEQSSSLSTPNLEQGCCNMILEATLSDNAAIEVLNSEIPIQNQLNGRNISSSVITPPREKRIEVCMGGKCKKSGAPALMEEFRRAVGNDGAVVGCKCMGKCKSGPNVRVMNGENNVDDGDSLRTPSNPICVGVGLEDVELIVANYFGEEKKGMGLAVAALPY